MSSLPSAPSVPAARTVDAGPWSVPALRGLIVAELRKTLSTSAWWGLLIPAALLSGLYALAAAASAGLSFSPALTQVFGLDFFASKFAMVFGAVCATAEYRHRTITTTFLTAPGRGQVVVAKAAVAALVGAVYGLVASVFGLLGTLIGGANLAGVDTGPVFAVSAASLPVFALWAVLGVGVGMLISNQLGAIVLLLLYVLLGERIINLFVALSDLGNIGDYLPAGSGTAALAELAGDGLFGASLTRGSLPWWGALLVFAGYAALAVLGGIAAARRRDVT
ncbi:ABC transporter permease [Pseudonocardia acaciae]|uniref:ABC transporter permease n=1 Tax=Pseudonocardia acaciae TaxID=551276 RepID=UPI00049150FB|nr:ABC transporter permease [Pseudonocardia acaciae]